MKPRRIYEYVNAKGDFKWIAAETREIADKAASKRRWTWAGTSTGGPFNRSEPELTSQGCDVVV